MAGRPIVWNEDKKKKAIDIILNEISEGKSVRSILNGADRDILPSNVTFCDWLSNDNELVKQYARATELRAEAILDEMMEIVDSSNADVYVDDTGEAKIDGNTVQRARLQYDARKWLLGKLNPKKYGDKIDVEQSGNITVTKINLKDAIGFDKTE